MEMQKTTVDSKPSTAKSKSRKNDVTAFGKLYAGVAMEPELKKTDSKCQLIKTSSQIIRTPYLSNEQISEIRRQVEVAVRKRRVFYVSGHYRTVRRALTERGWVEKIQARSPVKIQIEPTPDPEQDFTDAVLECLPEQQTGESMDQHLRKCEKEIKARMLHSHPANLYWNIKKESLTWLPDIPRDALINRFPRARFTSKEGLCMALQQMHWYTEPGVSDTAFPRCYNLTYPDQFLAFVDDFRLTSCMAVLKTFLQTMAADGEVAVRSLVGSLPISAIYFAIERCEEFIRSMEHDDIDTELRRVWDHEWENFFASAEQFLTQHKRFLHKAGEESSEIIREKITKALKQMHKHWPQYNLDGNRNIWIVKPGNRCRGQGIMILDKFQRILSLVLNCNPKKNRYVIQKYVERPLLVYDTKFDIRQWFLLTSAQPLNLWMYTECYLRFSSQIFNLQDYHESIHLTNNAVQKKYRHQLAEDRSRELPEENMWDCHTFKAYLRRIGQHEKWDAVVYPGMKQAIVGAMLASQEFMDRNGNYFELYGADFILSQDLVPWLLEINSSPDMSSSTSVTRRMCPQCLEDVVKVVVDRRENPGAPTGLFELAYKQACPRPPAYLGLQLMIRGRRMLRHKTKQNRHHRGMDNINLSAGDIQNLLKTDDYQGPIIGDFVQEIHQDTKKDNATKRTAGVRHKRKVTRQPVQQFQPTIKTITMKPKPLIHTPFPFSVQDKAQLKKNNILSQSLQNLSVRLMSCSEKIPPDRISTTACRSSSTEMWKRKMEGRDVTALKFHTATGRDASTAPVKIRSCTACPRLTAYPRIVKMFKFKSFAFPALCGVPFILVSLIVLLSMSLKRNI